MSELTETTIRQYATPESFRRGRDYYEQGAVLSLARRGDQLLAEVEGSQYEPYRVQVTLDAGDVAEAICTCPYDWGGYCKHIVATLLAYIHEPDQVEERPTLESLLDGLGADQLREILLSLIERRPGLDDVVEAQVLALQSPSEGELAPRQRRTPLDPAPFRRQVRDILHSLDHMRSSEAYWHVGGVVDGVRRVLDQARAYVEANDGRNALVILEAITEEYVAGWVYLDDSDGEAGGFFGDLGEVWIEAILITALTPEEREQWAERLARWQGEVDDYGIDAVFSAAEAAARQGWDYLPLQRVLQGEITDKGAWEDEAPPYADDLAVARLNVLERQGRRQEYLCLAEAEGQFERYLTMLVRVGRVQEAVERGLTYMTTTDEALALAQALREQEEIKHALRVAEYGLGLNGHKVTLARWLRDLASSAGRSDLALNAALIAFHESPSLDDYLAVQAQAGEKWPQTREELLDHLRQNPSYYPRAHVDIFMHEGLAEDAIAAVEKHTHSYDLIEQVVDGVLHTHPDWAIRACRHQAEVIIEPGKSRHYHHAVRWLEKARDAYQAAGQETDWRAYLEDLIARHGRKYSLVPMLERLR